MLVALFISLTQQFELNCKFEGVGWDDVIDTAFTCNVQNLNLTQPKILITKLSGELPVGKSNGNVNTILIFEQICEFLPVGIENFFKGIEGIAIQKSSLKRITKSDLQPFKDLRSLSLFENKLTSLESNLFMFNPKLKIISLFSNQLVHIHPNMFNGLNDLKRIYMTANPCINDNAENHEKIEQLKSKLKDACRATDEMLDFADIEDENFGLKSKAINLEENYEAVAKDLLKTKRKLEALQENFEILGSLNGTESASTLKANLMTCELEKIDLIELVQELEIVEIVCGTAPDAKQCNAVNLKVLKPNLQVVNVRSKDKSFLNANLITELVVLNQQMVYLPLNISNFFPNLKKISIINSGLIEINEDALQNLNLIEVQLFNNQLTEIRSRSLQSLHNLIKLDLSSNKISSIDANAFKKHVKLAELKLNDNLLKTIEAKTFSENKNLKILMLHNNKLKQIASNFFQILRNLENLDLSNNVCVDLKFPETSLDDMQGALTTNCIIEIELECRFELHVDYICNVVNLEISSKNVKVVRIKGAHLVGKTNKDVTVLKIINQSMAFIPENLGKVLGSLMKIQVENSKLEEINEINFVDLERIKELTIKSNKLEEISDKSFEKFLQLELLNLSHNVISNLTEKLLKSLNKLKIINLSHNKLEMIQSDLVDPSNVIENFNFSHNLLTSIDPKIIMLLKRVKIIDLEGNNCIDSKYDETINNKKKIMEIYGEISFKCTEL